MTWRLWFGANCLPQGGVEFRVWAPEAREVALQLEGSGPERIVPMLPEDDGVFGVVEPTAGPGSLYRFLLDRTASYPDPYSRYQPRGPHGPSQVVDTLSFVWTDSDWPGLQRDGQAIYELHVGTFTPEGTFAGVAGQLHELARLGISAIELMPVAEFPGARNWGYDGVDLFAPSHVYGGPEGLQLLVDAAHAHGLGVILDVVYNHLGPDGNYLRAFAADYFTDRHHTPWGEAVNYDGPGARRVRDLVVQNAIYWLLEYHLDGLRLDATHAIIDESPYHILAEIKEQTAAATPPGRNTLIIAESDRNEVHLVDPPSQGGFGLDAVWADDFHHAMHTFLTGERDGYYVDYTGQLSQVARAIEQGFLYQGEESRYWGRPRGTLVTFQSGARFIFSLQNHDQVGNRALGQRLNQLTDPGQYAAASLLLLTVPETPLLWMGQEFAASAPFLYFTDHEPELGRQVTAGRRREFERFDAFSEPGRLQQIPDPQAVETFERSRLDLSERETNAGIYGLYQELLALRLSDPVLVRQDRFRCRVVAREEDLLVMYRWFEDKGFHRLVLVNFGEARQLALPNPPEGRQPVGDWRVLVSSWAALSSSVRSDVTIVGTTVHLPARGAALLAVDKPDHPRSEISGQPSLT